MNIATAAVAVACSALALLSSCSTEAPPADAGLRHDPARIDQLIDSVIFYEALIAPNRSSHTISADEDRS